MLISEDQSMTLTKAQIVEALFAKKIFTKTQSAQIIDTLFALIKQSLQNGEKVLISGFGKLSVRSLRNSAPQNQNIKYIRIDNLVKMLDPTGQNFY